MSSEEEQLRAQLEEEMRRITVDDLLVQTVVSLINLAGRRIGLAPGTEGERDPAQVKTAIDAVQALLPLLERESGEAIKPIRDALAQLQMAYAREATGAAPDEAPAEPAGGGPAQSSGRLWIPGQ
jgi:hypothetical protein